MSPTASEKSRDAFVRDTLVSAFEKRQDDEKAKFMEGLDKAVEKALSTVEAALLASMSGKAPRASRSDAGGSRKSWTSLPDAKKEKWIGEIMDAGKAKAKREALMKSFREAEGFNLREGVIDKIQVQAS